jgi:regulator of sirC expression with transglutaminase-like and TPR domain
MLCMTAFAVIFVALQVARAQSIPDIQELNALSHGGGAPNTQEMNALLLRMNPPEKVQADNRHSRLTDPGVQDGNLAVLHMMLNQPDESIDLAKVEVVVEHMIDPQVNQAETLRQLDALAENARARFPQGDATDTEQKGLILISTMKDPGPWNDNRPFRYDLDNPLGLNVTDKLLSHFLATRLGNCVSMPVMFVILGQKLGLPVTLSTAPLHVFAKFKKDDGQWQNIEVTSYGTISDLHYQQQMEIPPLAMANKLYLQTLTRKQAALVIIEPLVEFYHYTNQAERELTLTAWIVHDYPQDVAALIYRGQAYIQLYDKRYKQYGRPRNIPPTMRADAEEIGSSINETFARVEALGWVDETPEHKAAYLKSIQQTKARQQGG